MPGMQRLQRALIAVALAGGLVMAVAAVVRRVDDRHQVEAAARAACTQRATRPDDACIGRVFTRSDP